MSKARTMLGFALLGTILVPVCALADTGISAGDYYILKRKQKKNPGRPQMPGMERFLTVTFSDGTMTVEIPGDAESGVVTIGTGAFDVFTATIDRSCNKVELPSLSGEFLLTVTFDNGDVYEGEISL